MNIENLSALADQKIQSSSGDLKNFREAELSLFKKNGFKSPVLDGYKFTNLETFFSGLNVDQNKSAVTFDKTNFPTLTFQDGELANIDLNLTGLKVKKLKDHFNEVKGLFKETNALSHLHHALFNDGIILEVEKNQEIKSPIRILHLNSKSSVTAPTVVILAHHFSKLTVLEETVGTGANVNETYIMAHPGSQVEHIQLDQGSVEGITHSSVFADIDKDATVRSLIFNTSGKLNRKNLALNLNAAGSHAESYALYLTNGSEHSDVNTVINHHAADTTSDQMAKGILDGDSKGIFTGKIHIHPKAQRVASGQLNKNLLLSKKAQAHSQPQLEIFADDVKCSHGSTTGQLSDDEVFYLEARGIPADKARTILAHGFGLEIVQKIQSKEAREFISPLILKCLETKFAIGRLT